MNRSPVYQAFLPSEPSFWQRLTCKIEWIMVLPGNGAEPRADHCYENLKKTVDFDCICDSAGNRCGGAATAHGRERTSR